MTDDLVARVKAAYRRHFKETRKGHEAYNRTLIEIAGPYDSNAKDDLRKQVGDILMRVRREIELDLGDSFALAVAAAMRDLKRDRVAENVRNEYRKLERENRDRLKDKFNYDERKGPKEWSPNSERHAEQFERAVERDRELYPNTLTLYIMFDDMGALKGWLMDHPDYWGGHLGPVATVSASDDIDYDEIQREIEDTLEDLDWEAIDKGLDEDLERDDDEA